MAQAALKKDAHPSTLLVTTQLKDIPKKLPLRVLSYADWQHWIATRSAAFQRCERDGETRPTYSF